MQNKTVELLAPAGKWDALTAAVEAGADAVYLGGKHFNMRVHKADFNFDDEALKRAVEYTHENDVKLYVTLNNLISEEELPELTEYLKKLDEIKPDAILVQDLAVIKLVRELNLDLPMHASIMMNTHNKPAIESLQGYGIKRFVVSRELSFDQVKFLKEQTGAELEYFIHGDMCISESGQCIHSGVLFGQSGNRGRCLKPCRWSYELIDESSGSVLNKFSHRLALNDMCIYRNIPELMNAGIYSFKIEGRMRPPEFIRRIVSIYRRAIDNYLDDPTGYSTNEIDWKELFDNRARNFTTAFAFNAPTKKDIGLTGEREPRYFSQAIKEPDLKDKAAAEIFASEPAIKFTNKPELSVRVSSIESAKAALDNGADLIYVGGEVFRPLKPWKLEDYNEIINFAHAQGKKVIINTPRTTYDKECSEISCLLNSLADKLPNEVLPDGIMVSNLGAIRVVNNSDLTAKTKMPVHTDLSFNLFNHRAAEFLKDNSITAAAASLELSYTQLKSLIESSRLPIEVVIHGSYESMICDHNFPVMTLRINLLQNPESLNNTFALRDKAGEIHSIKIDQFGRNHLYFAKDLCLYNYLEKFLGAALLRIEAQLYSPEQTASVVKAYRTAIDSLIDGKSLPKMSIDSPRPLGVGIYRFRQSKNSI